MKRGDLRDIVIVTYLSWRSHRTVRLAAGVAYYSLFAAAPLLLLSLSVTGVFFDEDAVTEQIRAFLPDSFDDEVSTFSRSVSESLSDSSGALALVGLGSLFVTASMLFVSLQDAFDVIWEASAPSGWQTIRRRALAVGVVIVTAAVLVLALAVEAVGGWMRGVLYDQGAVSRLVADAGSAVASLVMVSLIVAGLFRVLTVSGPGWQSALISGCITAVVMLIGSRLVGIYLTTFGTASLTGAASSVLVVLFWLYSLAQMLLAGAELCRSIDAHLVRRSAEVHGAHSG